MLWVSIGANAVLVITLIILYRRLQEYRIANKTFAHNIDVLRKRLQKTQLAMQEQIDLAQKEDEVKQNEQLLDESASDDDVLSALKGDKQ